MASYDHRSIEKKWQAKWDPPSPRLRRAGEAPEDPARAKDKLYHLVMFPYPSGAGLHVGHVESYAALDILTRRARMQGKNVLFPIGYDAFGLPAENYAVKTGVHPAETTKAAIENFRRQMKSLGLSFDWSREISTADPEYYKWTQWLFLLLYKNDLAYRAKAPVNWCPSDHTVLANEQVVDGTCDRCGTVVVQKELEQWFFRITKYADRLLAGLDRLDWPERIKSMQRNWIGKSEGVEIEFHGTQGDCEFSIPVFTTRADTLFGVSYVVLAPEHALVDELCIEEKREELVRYRDQARKKSELERTQLERDKSGVFLGAYAKHPLTGEDVPLYVSDYVLTSYGTGAVMGVPAHDDRDYAFAKKYDLPVKWVVASPNQDDRVADQAYVDEGVLTNSGSFNGLTSHEAVGAIAAELESKGRGKRITFFRLRDWLVSRQRYWGAPIPIVWCDDCGAQPVEPKSLPVELPTDVDFKPTGESPLKRSASFQDVDCPKCGKAARRESDTMDTFVDSSWYFLRYCDPHNDAVFADEAKLRYWSPVDLYVGGAEHAVLHLLYSRFVCYALRDLGYVEFDEPFLKLRNQGLILGPDGEKMSKSKGNVINPDDIVHEYGADALRLYEMFMGPLEDAKPWDTKGLVGVRRFLDKAWACRTKLADATDPELSRVVHKTIKKVSDDLDQLKFNTAISQLMICTNAFAAVEAVPRGLFATFVTILAPFAPHLAEELWTDLGHKMSVFQASWPVADASLIKDAIVKVAVSVNGKVRATIDIAPDLPQEEAVARALATENVEKYLAGAKPKKVIYVPGRMINIVV
ncbi:leucine--tRNA ligase [Patescibacteria group bacterium]|nr:MAG: leucine--tRNA ligase [Patescibacteria group bacterium]